MIIKWEQVEVVVGTRKSASFSAGISKFVKNSIGIQYSVHRTLPTREGSKLGLIPFSDFAST